MDNISGKITATQYEPTLKREEEKAAMVFRKMQYAGHHKYREFLFLWHDNWAADFKDCDRHNLKEQFSNSCLSGNQNDIWLERYRHYSALWKGWKIDRYNTFIKECKEQQIPVDIKKRLSELQIVAEQAKSKKKLGGYKLKERIDDITGKSKWKIIGGRKYDLSISDIVDFLNERNPENQISFVPVEKPKSEKAVVEKSQKPKKKHERITYDEVNDLLKVPDKIEYVEPAPGEVASVISRSHAISWKVRLKALSQMSKFQDKRVDERLVEMIKRDQSKHGRDVATRYANLRGLGGKEGFPFPPKYSPLSKNKLMPKIERGLVDVGKYFKQKNIVPTFKEIIYEFRKHHENFYLLVEGYMYSPSNPMETHIWFRKKCNKLKIKYSTAPKDANK